MLPRSLKRSLSQDKVKLTKTSFAARENRETVVLKTTTTGKLETIFGASEAKNMCIVDADVHVDVTHPCTGELYIDVLGPGHRGTGGGASSRTSMMREHSRGEEHLETTVASDADLIHTKSDVASHSSRVRLFAGHHGKVGGCGQNLVGTSFDDEASASVDDDYASPFHGHYRPVDSLSSFVGLPALGPWSLRVHSKSRNRTAATINHWHLKLMLEPCHHAYRWRQLTPSNTAPSARYGHSAVVVGGTSMFVFGGQDSDGRRCE